MSKKSFFAGDPFGHGRLPGRCWLLVFLFLPLLKSGSAALYLDLAPAEAAPFPLSVMAGQKQEFVLTLTASATLAPELTVDLAAVNGSLAAPVASGLKPALHRIGEAKAGSQRFSFELEIPAAKRKQAMVLYLKVRPEAGQAWLPFPPVNLVAQPATWKEALRAFAHVVPCGRLGDDALGRLFTQAELEVPVGASGEQVPPGPRVWFAAGQEELSAPAGAEVLWVVFKPGLSGSYEVRRAAPGAPLMLAVNERALRVAQNDAVAQDMLEQALAAAYALTGVETPLSPP